MSVSFAEFERGQCRKIALFTRGTRINNIIAVPSGTFFFRRSETSAKRKKRKVRRSWTNGRASGSRARAITSVRNRNVSVPFENRKNILRPVRVFRKQLVFFFPFFYVRSEPSSIFRFSSPTGVFRPFFPNFCKIFTFIEMTPTFESRMTRYTKPFNEPEICSQNSRRPCDARYRFILLVYIICPTSTRNIFDS